MSFWGFFITNNLIEIIAGTCVLIVMGYGFTVLGRKLERQRMRKMGSTEWQAYLADPKRWLATSNIKKL